MKSDVAVQKVILIIKVLVILNIILAAASFYEFKKQKVPYYRGVYKKDDKTYLIKMVALSRPVMTRQVLLQWAGQAAVAAYTYDVANYQTQLNDVIKKYFTKQGGNALRQAFQNSGALNNLLSKKLVVTSVVNGAPLILKEGALLGQKTWRVQVPLLVDYQSASAVGTDSYIVSMLITRIPTTEKPTGIGISQFQVYRAN